MFRRDNISQTVNNYISGGIGGPGGAGNAHGQGGGGGIGEGPALNYVFDTIENFTMNNLGLQIHNSNLYPVSGDISLMIQNSQLHDPHFSLPAPGRSLGIEAGWSEGSNHDILGVTRKVRRQGHEIGTRYTPYNKFFHPCPAITGSTEQNQSSSSHTSLSAPTLDLFSHFTSQSSHTQTSPPITLPPFCFDIPSSGPQLTHPSEYLPRIDQENLHHAPTPSSQYQHGSALLNPPPMSPVGHPHSHDSTHFTDFTTPSPWDYEYGGGRDQKHQSHHVQPLQSIHSGTFITAGNINHHHGEVGIHILSRGIALNALYNSAERFPQPRCHPETRTELIEKLYCWATDPSITRSIHWLHGPAGAGKSAVMQTLCERLQNTGQICGSFFFKRGDQTRGNAKMLFATLAYQLAICWHRLKAMVSLNVEIDPSVLGRGMDVQLHTLIVEPCKWLQNNSPPVLLIDGLDECEGHHIQQEIICLIQSAVKSHFWGVRILVASRPEAHIKETFEAEFFQGVTVSTNIQQSFEDIRTYLCHEFLRIHHKHSAMKNIPTPWPSLQTLEILVKRSSGYFVYAATVIKFVDDEYSWPSKQLDIVVQNLIPHDSEPVFATLDQLYIQILSRVKVRYHPSLCSILSVITHYPNTFTVRDLDALLGLELGTVELILRPLHSVLEIPDFRFIIRVYHASFLDFLKDETRSSSFYVGSAEHKAKLGHSILKALAYTYEDPQKNLADSSLYWFSRVSRSWIRFITSISPSADLVPPVQLVNPDFLLYCNQINYPWDTEKFLIWLKVCAPNPFCSCVNSARKKIHPVPEALIRRWQDYSFVLLYEDFQNKIVTNLLKEYKKQNPGSNDTDVLVPSLSTIYALHSRMTGEGQAIVTACRDLLSQSPNLVHIFHARRLLIPVPSHNYFNQLFQPHIVFNLPWDDILGCICSLRPLTTQESLFFHTIFLLLPAFCRELDHLHPTAMVSRDLACGYLRLMQQIEGGDQPMSLWKILQYRKPGCEWGRHIRSSPQSDPELLQKLNQFLPPQEVFLQREFPLAPVEFHDVIQWLKTSPNPQPNLIDRWQGYLAESIVQDRKNSFNQKDYSDDTLEKRWQDHLKRETDFHRPPQEEVIQCWETVLRKAREEDKDDGGEDSSGSEQQRWQ